jgi:putative membrane protein
VKFNGNALMFKEKIKTFVAGLLFTLPARIQAEVPGGTAGDWHAKTLWEALLYTVLFALVGIVLSIVGYKIFDLATPGDLHREIIENKNLPAAMIGAAVIIGTCILVAAAIIG